MTVETILEHSAKARGEHPRMSLLQSAVRMEVDARHAVRALSSLGSGK